MEFSECRDVRWKEPEKRNKPDVVATTAKHPDSHSQISRYRHSLPQFYSNAKCRCEKLWMHQKIRIFSMASKKWMRLEMKITKFYAFHFACGPDLATDVLARFTKKQRKSINPKVS